MTVKIMVGDAREQIKLLHDESVHMVCTSPPYWRQRDYGMSEQIGLEEHPEDYVANMVDVFMAVHRVLRKDGSLWLNIGDKWASGGHWGGGSYMQDRGAAWEHAKDAKGWRSPPSGLKDKDLVGVPWMLAFALRDRGWYLRQCNIWAKPNCMPESVSDRSTASHEYVFHLTKSADYFYDDESARTPAAPSTQTRLAQNVEGQTGSSRANGGSKSNGPMRAVEKQAGHSKRPKSIEGDPRVIAGSSLGIDARKHAPYKTANLRSVWWIPPAQYTEGHYAVMPSALAEICIVAGCPVGGTVLDPFSGAGTTGLVADRLQRDAILIELNESYARMALKRIKAESPMFSDVSIWRDGVAEARDGV